MSCEYEIHPFFRVLPCFRGNFFQRSFLFFGLNATEARNARNYNSIFLGVLRVSWCPSWPLFWSTKNIRSRLRLMFQNFIVFLTVNLRGYLIFFIRIQLRNQFVNKKIFGDDDYIQFCRFLPKPPPY